MAEYSNISFIGESDESLLSSFVERFVFQGQFPLSFIDQRVTSTNNVIYYKLQGLKSDGSHVTWVSTDEYSNHPLFVTTERSVISSWIATVTV